MAALLPLFPLQAVVFPRTSLPLHIFEPRYKRMVGEAVRDASEFGIVLAREQGIVNTGCSVLVEKVLKRYGDGRMDILTRGVRRFEVVYLDQQEDCLRAEVSFFDDAGEAAPPAALQAEVLTLYKELVEVAGPGDGDPNLEDPQLSFQLAQSLTDLDFLMVLLGTRSEEARLRELQQYLTQHLPLLRRTMRMRTLAPHNGFGGKPGGM
ncbi:MAG: LON peptidase substrate-binding domain-containing protein [Bryobacteraceae bacterium]